MKPISVGPTLYSFLQSNALYRCVRGPFGSGKSTVCVQELVRRACEQKPDAHGIRRTRWAVVRNTFPQLRDTTRKTFEQWIPANTGDWKERDFQFNIDRPDGQGGRVQSEILFRALDGPAEVRNLLSLELTGAYINEAREIAQPIFDGLTGRIGRYPPKTEGGPSWRGIWMDTNPWHPTHWLPKLLKKYPGAIEVFKQPGGRAPNAENLENLDPGYYERMCIGKDADWIRVYVDGEDAPGDVGSVYGALIEKLEQRGGICEFEHPREGVFTSWDLGHGDHTAIWFWLVMGGQPVLIDWYEDSSKPLSHYFDVLEARGYTYARHWLPHDGRAKTLQTGASTVERFIEQYGAGAVDMTPQLSIADGLQAGRWMLERPMLIHSRCAGGIDALRAYRYEWDEEARSFGTKPLHDWSSDTADAFRYLACALRNSGFYARKQEPEKRPPAAVPVDGSFTLDQLFTLRESERRWRR